MHKTSIEWCDYTSNPIRARHRETGRVGWYCVKCSAGCKNCYAEPINRRFGTGLPFTGNYPEPFLDEGKLQQILTSRHISGKRVFLCDMTDLFGVWVPGTWILKILRTIEQRPDVTFIALTKRADRMQDFFWGESGAGASVPPLSNLWLGVSVEDESVWNRRVSLLRQTPAAVRFVSLEPLLESAGNMDLAGIDWVITGGESGMGARPCYVGWIRSIVQQCEAAGVPCFVKQLGDFSIMTEQMHRDDLRQGRLRLLTPRGRDRLPEGTVRLSLSSKGGRMDEWPADLQVRQWPEVTR